MVKVVFVTFFFSLLLYLLINSIIYIIANYHRDSEYKLGLGYKITLFSLLNIILYFIFKKQGKIYRYVYSLFVSYLYDFRDTRAKIQPKLKFIKCHWWTVLIFFLLFILSFIIVCTAFVEAIKAKDFENTFNVSASSFSLLSLIITLFCIHKTNVITVSLCFLIIPTFLRLKKVIANLDNSGSDYTVGWFYFDICFLWIYFYPDSLLDWSVSLAGYVMGLGIGCLIKPFFSSLSFEPNGYDSEGPIIGGDVVYDPLEGPLIIDRTDNTLRDECNNIRGRIDEINETHVKDSDGHIKIRNKYW